MARRIKTTKTDTERRAEAEQLQATIAEQVERLRTSEAWTQFVTFAQQFHRYSLNNVLLILAACPTATHVAGYRTWQKLGRQVRKGERGIRIFGGRDVTVTVEDANGDEKEERRTRFFPVSVFDLSQTEAIDPDAPEPAELAQRLTGDDPAGILDAVTDYLTGKGWTVDREPIAGQTNGFTTIDGTKRVVIDSTLAPAQAAKTGLHEAAHVLMHADEKDATAQYAAHRGIKETEAESVAYIVAGILGLDTSAYSIGYVAGWSESDVDLIKSTAAAVLRTAHTLADALTVTDTAEAVEAA